MTKDEIESLEITDFGLGHLETEGLQLIVYENNERYCAKELALLPGQVCSEHKHPPRENDLGKMETFRCRYGEVWLYVEGNELSKDNVFLKEVDATFFTAGKKIYLTPGQQYTIPPDTFHWFVAGEAGAIISEFSSPSDDSSDVFQNPKVKRV